MIYIHVPFCRSFCTYCDFYSEIACRGKDELSTKRYVKELCSEIKARADEIRVCNIPNTLYLGGGTPSVLPLTALSDIVDSLRSVRATDFEEFTFEVNPEDIVEKGCIYASGLKAIGINRISMGVQSFDDDILRWMNRRHNAKTAIRAFEILRSAGFDNISLDLIFGISGLNKSKLEYSLKELLALRPEHISAYQLSIEPGSKLNEMLEQGKYEQASEEECAEQYDLICRELMVAGYYHYEISNWALSGFEAKHNSAYWSRQAYVGLGPAAHSYNGKDRRSWNQSSLSGWRNDSCFELLGAEEQREERILLGLRTAAGVDSELCNRGKLSELVGKGLLVYIDGGRVRITEEHFFISDEIISSLI